MPNPLPADTAPAPVPWATWESAIASAPRSPGLPAGATVLCIAAHPDDETIGAGRLLAAHDGPVRAVTLTAGERCFGDGEPTDLVARERLDEWAAALRILGVEPLDTKRWPDGELRLHEDEATQHLMALVGDAGLVVAPWRHDPHPDHEAAGRIAARVADLAELPLLSYPVWAPYWLEPERLSPGHRLAVVPTDHPAGTARDEALRCFPSQIRPRPPAQAAVVPAELLQRHPLQLLILPGDEGA